MKRTVYVTIAVEVEIDETKFTPEWMAEFRQYFYDFHEHEDHIKHLAQLSAREMIGYCGDVGGNASGDFIEGYGESDALGIVIQNKGVTEEEIE